MTTTTPQPPSHLNIPVLTASNYHVWRLATTSAGKKALPTNGPLGGLGLLLPSDEFAALNDNQPYELAVRPANVTNATNTYQQACYDREQVALGTLTAAVYDSIPTATQQACPGYHALYGTSFIPLPIMMCHVHAKFGDASINAYNQAKASLQNPYIPGMDIDVFLSSQVDAHLACVRAHNPLNDMDKVNYLIHALGGRSGAFSFTILKFEEDTADITHRKFEDTPAVAGSWEVDAIPATDPAGLPGSDDHLPARPAVPHLPARAAQEKQEGLATRIRKAAPRILDAPAVPTTKGYFGAAEVVPSLQDTIKEAVADAVTAANAASRRDRIPPRRDLYCWSHGLGGHNGTQCKNPRTGHDPRATSTKRLGGSNKGCQK